MNIYRELEQKLSIWADSSNRKPLLLRGARQVGKSHLAKAWGKKTFGEDAFIEINLEENQDYKTVFERDSNVERIIEELSFITGRSLSQRPFITIY